MYIRETERESVCVCGGRQGKGGGMLTFEATGERIDGNSLYSFCNYKYAMISKYVKKRER